MSEVKRYLIQKTPIGTMMKENPEGNWVAADDFDAQRLRADTADEALEIANQTLAQFADDLDECDGERHRLLDKLAAAEQRIAELHELLRLMTVEYACCLEAGHDRITFLGGDCDSVSKMLDDNVNYAKACAALNQKSECCTVSPEEQALLDSGDYRPEELFGIGGKPSCPKCFNQKSEGESQ